MFRFNYRSTAYMVEHGFYDFLNWFDERAWYPLGRYRFYKLDKKWTESVISSDPPCKMIMISLKKQKHWYIIHTWSGKVYKGTVVNLALYSFNGGSQFTRNNACSFKDPFHSNAVLDPSSALIKSESNNLIMSNSLSKMVPCIKLSCRNLIYYLKTDLQLVKT